MEEFFQSECDAGNQQACERLKKLSVDLEIQQRLERRSEEFWESVDTDKLMLDEKRPNREAAYPLVMRDFIISEKAAGSSQELAEERLSYCASHYHNHWINKKLWYPTNDEGLPSWPSIYEFIVDHYYGFCLRQ